MTTKIISSIDRCFPDTPFTTLEPLSAASMLKNERYSFQLAYQGEPENVTLKIESPLAPWISVQKVCYVVCERPLASCRRGEGITKFLALSDRTAAGLFPVRLEPMQDNTVSVTEQMQTLWIDIKPNADLQAGKYPIKLTLGNTVAELEMEVIDAELPETDFMYTQWFYCDCLASYYKCETWSERHWQIIENFMKTARENGIDTILTPVFTPALDTAVGHERPTTQLVDIWVENGTYRFGFDRLDRWIDLCNKIGFRQLEISHFFTQWGAKHAPKIVATVNGKEEKIFGWDTDAQSDEYVTFLRTFIAVFLEYMKKKGMDKRCLFHISDEPSDAHLETYKRNKENIADLLEGYRISDAMSHYEYYEQNIIPTPFPTIEKIQPFLDHNVPDLHTYYAVWPTIAITPACTRGIVNSFFQYNITGFLNWGYNFYYNQYSLDQNVDPYQDNHGGDPRWVPCGDPFSVYPAPDGTAYETVYLVTFANMLQDLRAYRLCEAKRGRQLVLDLIREICGNTPVEHKWIEPKQLLTLREKINRAIAEATR